MDYVFDIFKTMGWIIYPCVLAYTSLQIARFHFERETKIKYLHAKDKVANDIINSLCEMLLSMWELANINHQIVQGQVDPRDQDVIIKKETAVQNFYRYASISYKQLGQMGLYYGTKIVDDIAQLQSEWNNMVNENDFSAFENWDTYRRTKVLPVLQKIHDELRNTVFNKLRSFRIYV